MTLRGVLVSVRDAAEAEEAIAGNAHVIDVKEPAHGSLGPAEPAAVAGVAAAVGDRVPWTMAAGELSVGMERIAAWLDEVRGSLPRGATGPAALKAGLAGMAGRPWQDELARLHAVVPPGCLHVAVAYADFDRVGAPTPRDVIAAAACVGCAMLLIDTSDKQGPGLFAARRPAEITDWVDAARRVGLGVALAGRVARAEIPLARAFVPDLVALRSAVCSNAVRGDPRLGRVTRALVAAAVEASNAWPAVSHT